MANWLPADPDEFVLELGPGTGSVTEAMLTRGLRHDRLIALEMSPRLADLLRARFPRTRIITGDALNLDQLIRKQVRHVDAVGAVISSLPLRNFEPDAACTVARETLLRPSPRRRLGAIQLPPRQKTAQRQFRLPPPLLRRHLVERPARPRQRLPKTVARLTRSRRGPNCRLPIPPARTPPLRATHAPNTRNRATQRPVGHRLTKGLQPQIGAETRRRPTACHNTAWGNAPGKRPQKVHEPCRGAIVPPCGTTAERGERTPHRSERRKRSGDRVLNHRFLG